MLYLALGLASFATLLAWFGMRAELAWTITASTAALALLVFGASERNEVSIIVVRDQLTVNVDRASLVTDQLGTVTDVAMRLEPYDVSTAASRGVDPVGRASPARLLTWAVNGNLLAGVTGFTPNGDVEALVGRGTILWQPPVREEPHSISGVLPLADPLQGPDGVYQRLATVRGEGFAYSFSLIRPSTPVRLLLRGPAVSTVVVLFAEHSAVTVERATDHKTLTRVAGGPLLARKSPLQSAQQLARLVGRAALTATAFVAVTLLLTRLVVWLLNRLRRVEITSRIPLGFGWRSFDHTASFDAAIVVSVFAVVVSAYVASEVLERMPHVQDSVAYLFQAKTFALGRISVPLPPNQASFMHEFVLMRDGLWYSKYAPGHPALLALGVLAGAPWLVSPLAAGAALMVTYLLSRALYGAWTAILAQLALFSSPFFLLMSGTMMSHPTGLLFAILFLWLLVVAEHDDRRPAALLAGLALGMLFASRTLTAVAFGAPFLLWVLVRLGRDRRIRARHLLFAVGAAIPLLGLLAYNRSLTGSWLTNPYELWWAFDRVGFGPKVGMHGGHYFSWGLTNTWANLAELQRWMFGWPVQLTLAFALVPFLTASRRLWDWLLGASVLAVVAAYVFYWADGIMFGPRYYYECAALLTILSVRGVLRVGEIASMLADRSRQAQLVGGGLALAAIAGLIVATAGWHTPGFLRGARGYNGMNGSNLLAVRRAGIHNALVLVAPKKDDLWQNYGSVFWANSPFLDGDIIYARDLGEAPNRALARAFPDRALYLLQDGAVRPYQPGGAANP